MKGYPTIKFFPAGKKKEAEEYDGGRTAESIVEWAVEKVNFNLPPPELIQITSDENLSKACSSSSICIISILPHILDCNAQCRNTYLVRRNKTKSYFLNLLILFNLSDLSLKDILRKQGEKYKKQNWSWLWAQGSDYLNLEEALDMGFG